MKFENPAIGSAELLQSPKPNARLDHRTTRHPLAREVCFWLSQLSELTNSLTLKLLNFFPFYPIPPYSAGGGIHGIPWMFDVPIPQPQVSGARIEASNQITRSPTKSNPRKKIRSWTPSGAKSLTCELRKTVFNPLATCPSFHPAKAPKITSSASMN